MNFIEDVRPFGQGFLIDKDPVQLTECSLAIPGFIIPCVVEPMRGAFN